MPITPDEVTILAAVESTFGTFWAGRTPIFSGNESGDPRSLQNWVRIAFAPPVGDAIGRTGLSMVQLGTLTFENYTRRGKGNLFIDTSVGLIRDYLFENRDIPETVVTEVAPVTIGSDGPWFQKNVVATLSVIAQRAAP